MFGKETNRRQSASLWRICSPGRPKRMRQDDGLNTSLTRHGQCCVAKGGGWRDENCDWL